MVPNWPMTWGAQLFKGQVFAWDLNSGLWVAKLEETVIIPQGSGETSPTRNGANQAGRRHSLA